jgi:hypothetical protein
MNKLNNPFVSVVLLLFLSALTADMTQASEVVNGAQLFVDLSRVNMANVRQVFHAAQKHPANPVIRKDKSWEFDSSDPTASVIYDDQEKLFKCWYQGWYPGKGENQEGAGAVLCYAVSKDGICWEKPNLGLCVSSLIGQPVRLRLYLYNAHLYSYQALKSEN